MDAKLHVRYVSRSQLLSEGRIQEGHIRNMKNDDKISVGIRPGIFELKDPNFLWGCPFATKFYGGYNLLPSDAASTLDDGTDEGSSQCLVFPIFLLFFGKFLRN